MIEANNLLGKVLLIGITLLDDEERLIEQFQVFGKIIRCSTDGVVIQKNGTDQEFSIPPDFESITPAQPGEYKLRSTGEVVTDPDYITSWTVNNSSSERAEKYKTVGFEGWCK
jgi:hypothetical protein